MPRPHLLDALRDTVLLCDGGMGSRVQGMTLDVDRDFHGKENCTDVLNLSRPDLVRDIHRGYFEAGADMVETNTFGGSPVTLAEFDIADRAFEINKRGGELAREAAEQFADGRHRWVIGSVGPGTKLPSLGNIAYDPLEAALAEQCRGLIAGGVDAILIETCQDTLQIKAAVNGAKIARAEAGSDIPIFVQVTVETTGTLLVGPDIAAAAAVVHALDVPLMGLNCATGPQEMAEHVRWLAGNWPGLLSVQPNAGLPELVDGQTHYPLGPAELASWLERFVERGRRQPDRRLLRHQRAAHRRAGCDAAPARRGRASARRRWRASRLDAVGRQPVPGGAAAAGERVLRHRRTLQRQRLEEVARGAGEARLGRLRLDGPRADRRRLQRARRLHRVRRPRRDRRDERGDPPLHRLGERAAGDRQHRDAGDRGGAEAAWRQADHQLDQLRGRREAAADRLKLAKQFGAAVIALTIDETGMAKTAEAKLEVARRLVDFACNRHGLPQSDLLIDPLTFTIATGNEDDRKLAQWTLEGIAAIRAEFPDIQIILGLSNVSFGLNPAARAVLNSVFLDHAVRAGMTGAIVHVSKIRPLHRSRRRR